MIRRDDPGPVHSPVVLSSGVNDVVIAQAPFVTYPGGLLTELFR